MRRIFDNGVYRDMTPEEIEELENAKVEQPITSPTIEERMDAIEGAIMELAEVIFNG